MEAARAKVRARQDALRDGAASPNPPTFEERWLASSTNGHLGRDAAHRLEGGRGNNCATRVDGYTENGALAMATLGNSSTRGTVEGDISALEREQAASRRAADTAGTNVYPAGARREDQDQVIETAVDSHGRNFPDGLRTAQDRPIDRARSEACEAARRCGAHARRSRTGAPGCRAPGPAATREYA